MCLLIKCIIKNIKVNKPECNYDMILMLDRKRKVVRNEQTGVSK